MKNSTKLYFVFFVFLASIHLEAQSLKDTLKIRQVDIHADRILQVKEAGVTKTKVDTLALIETQNLNLTELIGEHTPIFIKHYGRGSLATASFRGTAPSHTQVHWNGINLNSPMLGMVDFSLIPVWFFEDADLYHGGGSLHLSGGALGGIIDLKSTPLNWQENVDITALYGLSSYHTYDYFTALKFGSKKWQSKTKLFHSESENDFPFFNNSIVDIDPITGEKTYPKEKNNSYYLNYGLLQEFYFRRTSNEIFNIRAWGQFTDRNIPELNSYEGPDRGKKTNNQKNKALRATAEWNKYLEKTTIHFNSGINHEQMDYKNIKITGLNESNPVIISNSTTTSWYNNFNFNYAFSETSALKITMQYDHHKVDSKEAVKKTGYKKKQELYKLSANYSGKIVDNLSFSMVLRKEWIDSKSKPFLPFLGLEYQPFLDKSFVVFANAAHNNHYPTLNDLYWVPGGNPDLKPEKAQTCDFGFRWEKSNETDLMKLSVSAFYNNVKDWIIWLPHYKGFWEPFNIKKVISKGLEMNIQAKKTFNKSALTLKAGYALTHSINYGTTEHWADESIGKQLVYIPVHSANLSTCLSIKNLEIIHNFTGYSKRFTTSSNETKTKREDIYPHLMNDLSFRYHIPAPHHSLDIQFKVFNLFNEKYRNVLSRPMPPRNYSLLIRYKFHK